jgi:large conductance mechanosensitive channel
VKDVIMPIVSYVTPAQSSYANWHIGRILIGRFLGEFVNFLTIAGVIFLVIVKLLGTIERAILPPDAPATKECPFCLSAIPGAALKCAHCTADLPRPEPPTAR